VGLVRHLAAERDGELQGGAEALSREASSGAGAAASPRDGSGTSSASVAS
jgi:hypothetical protein